MKSYTLLLISVAACLASICHAAVQTTEDADKIVIDNGIVGITVAKHGGVVSSIRCRKDGQEMELGAGGRAAMVYDFDGHTGNPRHFSFNAQQGMTVKLVNSSPESADIAVNYEPTTICPFNVEFHWIVRQQNSGFYTYIVYSHHKGMPACTWEQTRAVIWGRRGTDVFTNYIVDDKRTGPFPSGKILATVFDTTWKYEFDNTAHSKYETTNFIGDDLVHGMAGHGVGLWLVAPSREYVNGGPLRQELSVHQDSPTQPQQNNVVLWMLQGNHFGGPNMEISADQEWTRFYGPAMVYVNQASTIDAMWADAKKKGQEEQAKWPYSFVKHDDYPLARGSVKGQIKISSGDSPKDAWVVLAAPGDKDWCMSAIGYEFWAKADADGRFEIKNVRPGKYTLFASGGNQFQDFSKENIEVVSAKPLDLGTLNWTAISHGKTLWQIGLPDRSSREFKDGDDVRHFVNYLHYGERFPNDVTFTIGKSKEKDDWNYAQWGWYSKRPYWSVLFDQPAALKGKGTLTVAIAAYDYPRGVLVKLNGTEIGKISLKKSGMSAYRCGGQDSLRQIVYLPFEGSLIKGGTNELQLEMIGAVPYDAKSEQLPNAIGAVMYDAIRMEVDPAAS